MKLDDLYADAAEVFVSTNKAAGQVWYAGMSQDEQAATVASFARNPGFQAALGRVLAILATEAGTEAWVVERGADGDHLIRRSDTMTTAMLVETFTRLGVAALDHLNTEMVNANVYPSSITRYWLSCQIQVNDFPVVEADGTITFEESNESATG